MSNLPAPPPPPKWATEIEDRQPKFKIHRTFGHVRAAIGSGYNGRVRGGKAYEWDESGAWNLLADVPPGTRKDSHDFFLGMDGGPQDIEKKRRQERARLASRLKSARQQVTELEVQLAEFDGRTI